MATKRDKRSGLAEPDVEGVDALFQAPKSSVPEEPQEGTTPQTSSQKQRVAITPAEEEPEDEQVRRVKTSFYISQEAHDLLHLLKFKARQSEGRHVSIGELLDTAIRDLAKKQKVAVDS